jgi:hypothetical protein
MSDESDAIRIEVNLNEAFTLKAEYDQTKVTELLFAIISYIKTKGPSSLEQNSQLRQLHPSILQWDTKLVLGPNEQGSFDDALSWYRNRVLEHGDDTRERNKGSEFHAHDFIKWVLPFILESIALPLLSASLAEASGNLHLSLPTLINGIKQNLDEIRHGRYQDSPSPLPTFDFTINDDYGGEVKCTYSYVPMVRELIKEVSAEVFSNFEREVASTIAEKSLAGEPAEQLSQYLYSLRNRILHAYTLIGGRLFIDGLPEKIKAGLTERSKETLYEVERELRGQLFKDEKGHSILLNQDLPTLLQNALTYAEKRTKIRLKAPGPGGSEALYDLTELPKYYQKLLSIWQAAAKDSKRDQKHSVYKKTWRERLSAYQLPDDLIEWLNIKPEDREHKLASHPFYGYLKFRREKSKGQEDQLYELSTSRDIALEHSARLCGAEPYFYSTGYLKGRSTRKRSSGKVKK